MKAGPQVGGSFLRRANVFPHFVLQFVGSHKARIVGVHLNTNIPYFLDSQKSVLKAVLWVKIQGYLPIWIQVQTFVQIESGSKLFTLLHDKF